MLQISQAHTCKHNDNSNMKVEMVFMCTNWERMLLTSHLTCTPELCLPKVWHQRQPARTTQTWYTGWHDSPYKCLALKVQRDEEHEFTVYMYRTCQRKWNNRNRGKWDSLNCLGLNVILQQLTINQHSLDVHIYAALSYAATVVSCTRHQIWHPIQSSHIYVK